jgi:hypothetical protein
MAGARITFNVCGTRYETMTTPIEDRPETRLAMLMRHATDEEKRTQTIFVQGDPEMFRWILYWYTSGGILVSHETVGVPKEVWDHEIRYYALFEKEEEKEEADRKRKLPPIDEEHELASRAKAHMAYAAQKVDEARTKRQDVYRRLLEYMIDHRDVREKRATRYDFINYTRYQRSFDWGNYPVEIRGIDLLDVDTFWSEFSEYCEAVGFVVKKEWFRDDVSGNSSYPPGNCIALRTKHQNLNITFSVLENEDE